MQGCLGSKSIRSMTPELRPLGLLAVGLEESGLKLVLHVVDYIKLACARGFAHGGMCGVEK